jgi:hypothetical protein
MALPYDASNPFLPRQPKTTSTTNNVTINVQGGDPKVLVNTLSQYVKQNGSLPFNLSNPPTRKIG